MGDCFNAALDRAQGDWISVWSDDDWYYANHLTEFSKYFIADFITLGQMHTHNGISVTGLSQGAAGIVCFKSGLGLRYRSLNTGEDQALRYDAWGITQSWAETKNITFAYGWGNGVKHISGSGGDYAGHKRYTLERVQTGQEPRGKIILEPRIPNAIINH